MIEAKSKYRESLKAFLLTFLVLVGWATIMVFAPFFSSAIQAYSFLGLPFILMPAIPLAAIGLLLGGFYIFLVSKEEKTTNLGRNMMFFPARFMLIFLMFIVPIFIVSVGILLNEQH